nr:YppE family protein [Neobacillus sp. Marseille-Q6967]
MSEEIVQLTHKLLDFNRSCLRYFHEGREKEINYEFHQVVKPFADDVRLISEKWSHLMRNWLIKYPQKNLHLKQIDTTLEHLNQLSIQAFFPKTSKTRFLNANRTVEFFLLEVLKELEK